MPDDPAARIRNPALRRISDSLDLANAMWTGHGRLREVRVATATRFGEVALAPGCVLRCKDSAGEDWCYEAVLAAPATVHALACRAGTVVGLLMGDPPPVFALTDAFDGPMDVGGFPVAPGTTVAFDAGGGVRDGVCATPIVVGGRTIPASTRIRFGTDGEVTCDPPGAFAAGGVSFPRGSELVFRRDGTLARALPGRKLTIGDDTFDARTLLHFDARGALDRVAMFEAGKLGFLGLTDAEKAEYARRRDARPASRR